MTRVLFILGVCLSLAACQESGSAPQATGNQASPAPAPKTAEATPPPAKTSVMRPSVIAESEEAPVENPPLPRRFEVMFEEGTSSLSEEARQTLDRIPDRALLEAPGIVLRGHSDSQGSDSGNLRSSEARAMAVLDYLVARGVPRDRVRVVALGEARPVSPNARLDGSDFPEGRARNRRVEIELDAPTAAPKGGAAQGSPATGSSIDEEQRKR